MLNTSSIWFKLCLLLGLWRVAVSGVEIANELKTAKNCSVLKTCAECTASDKCGWCDCNQSCVTGNGHGPTDKSSCGSYFFYSCLTDDLEGSKCSDQISPVDCMKNCSSGKRSKPTPREKFTCRQCKEFLACFDHKPNGCNTWNESRCPDGSPAADYSDPTRIEETVIRDDVVFVEPEKQTLYMCLFSDDSDKVVQVVAGENIGFDIAEKTILSNQAGGIINKVDQVIPKGPWSFAITRRADMADLVELADFQTQLTSAKKQSNPSMLKHEEATEELIQRLRKSSHKDISNIKPIFRMIVNPYEHKDYKESVVLLPKSQASSLNVSDIIYGDSSSGFLSEVDSKEVGIPDEQILVKTKLAWFNSNNASKYNFDSDIINFNEKSVYGCVGGIELNYGIHVFEEKPAEKSLSLNQVVSGRNSGAFALQVTQVYNTGELFAVKGRLIKDYNQNKDVVYVKAKKYLPPSKFKAKAHFLRNFNTSFPHSHDCSKILQEKCPFCEQVECKAMVQLDPSIQFGFKMEMTWQDLIKKWTNEDHGLKVGIGMAAAMKLRANYSISSTFSQSKTLELDISIPVKTVTFQIPIPSTPVSIPGTIRLDAGFSLVGAAEGKITLKSSAEGTIEKSFMKNFGENVGLTEPPRNGEPRILFPDGSVVNAELNELKVNVTSKFQMEFTVTWPNFEFADLLQKITKKFPSIGKLYKKLPTYITNKLDSRDKKLDIEAKFKAFIKANAEFERCGCFQCNQTKDETKHHSLELRIGPGVNIEIGAHLIWYNPKWTSPDLEFMAFSKEICLALPKINSDCENTNLKCGAKFCECPDGKTPPVQASGECKCPCKLNDVNGTEHEGEWVVAPGDPEFCKVQCTCPDSGFQSWRDDKAGLCLCNNVNSFTCKDFTDTCYNNATPTLDAQNMCRCPAITKEELFPCGVSPNCTEYRTGPYCFEGVCTKLNNCSGNGNCIAKPCNEDEENCQCLSMCECKRGWCGPSCNEIEGTCVLSQNAYISDVPSDMYTRRPIKIGERVTVIGGRCSWNEIQLADGFPVWIKNTDIGDCSKLG